MKPPAWVNWEQFANLNEEETKRAEQSRQQARADEQENFLSLTGQLQNEAMGQAGARQFGGLEKIGKFKDVMSARDAAMKNQAPMMGAAWEQYLDPNKNAPYKSPWANLDQRLGQIAETAQRGQAAAVRREKDKQERDYREQQSKVRAQQDAVDKANKAQASAENLKKFNQFLSWEPKDPATGKNIPQRQVSGASYEYYAGLLANMEKAGIDLSDPAIVTELSNRNIEAAIVNRYLSSKSKPKDGAK